MTWTGRRGRLDPLLLLAQQAQAACCPSHAVSSLAADEPAAFHDPQNVAVSVHRRHRYHGPRLGHLSVEDSSVLPPAHGPGHGWTGAELGHTPLAVIARPCPIACLRQHFAERLDRDPGSRYLRRPAHDDFQILHSISRHFPTAETYDTCATPLAKWNLGRADGITCRSTQSTVMHVLDCHSGKFARHWNI